jgi:uncharacterized protein
MLRVSNIRLSLDAYSDSTIEQAVCERLGVSPEAITAWRLHRKSVDARGRRGVLFVLTVDVDLPGEDEILARLEHAGESGNVCRARDVVYSPPKSPSAMPGSRPVVVGTGPCGLFCGLILAQAGLRPILIERGKPALERAKDVTRLWRKGELDTESNVQFGEGGAGTFSDGKLTSGIKDREGRCRKVLEEFVAAGAPEEILYLNRPHIGTDMLIRVVGGLRSAIENLGGEVRFQTCLRDLMIRDGAIRGVVVSDPEADDKPTEIETNRVVLAIGHSARDTFEMLAERGVAMEPKSFAIGLRIEHPQELVDQAQYGACAGHSRLGAADYQMVHHPKGPLRSAYTFCMCPGGAVIAAASEPGGIVTNGMSGHARNRPNANAALLVGVDPNDFIGVAPSDSPSALAGMFFQRHWERAAFDLGGGEFRAPAQLLSDFLQGCPSTAFGDVRPSYRPGVIVSDLSACLPDYVVASLREALGAFGRKLKGFNREDAVLTGVETRSSSPVRLPRGATFESANLAGLYPAGEGAGHAGGIMSSAVDGIRAAEEVIASHSRR